MADSADTTPESPRTRRIQLLLGASADGDEDARAELLELLYGEMRDLAHALMARQPKGHTLQSTALVHEAALRLLRIPETQAESRGQFLALAAQAMRSVLVDHARARSARKRGGDRSRVPLDSLVEEHERSSTDLVVLEEAIDKLAAVDDQLAQIVVMRFFGGHDSQTIAEALGVSRRTVERGWQTAKAWLAAELGTTSTWE